VSCRYSRVDISKAWRRAWPPLRACFHEGSVMFKCTIVRYLHVMDLEGMLLDEGRVDGERTPLNFFCYGVYSSKKT